MKKNVLLSLYFVIRYITIMLLVFFIGGMHKIEIYGVWLIIYYISLNYLAVKYGVIGSINKREDLDKNQIFISTSVLLIISNIIIYAIYKVKPIEMIILSSIPVIMFRIIKTNKEKQKIIDINTKKAIDEYFKNKK